MTLPKTEAQPNATDYPKINQPNNPPVGVARVFFDQASGKLKAIDSSGNSILGSGTPGGGNAQVQYNNNGTFAGSSAFLIGTSPDTASFETVGEAGSAYDFSVSGAGAFGAIAAGDNGDLVVDLSGFAANRITIQNTEPSGAGILLHDTSTGIVVGSAADKVSFYGKSPSVVKPTVTGSKGANAALTSLLTALASLGLITDSSS